MNHGAIGQSGTPEKIYKHPRSGFVANFIGRANFVPATVVEAAVTVVLRPEMIWIPEDRGGLQGLVRRALYLGDAIEYDVEVAGQRLTFTETNPLRMQVHEPGSQIQLDFREEVMHLLPAVSPDGGEVA